ncbi:hypothetical protein INR49_001643 [Caranx melampygus]|nr:hypothetical protein INR49_001643 [Caranx melampygus]
MYCKSEDQYHKDGKCCDRCPAANRTTDAACAPCQGSTYSNVTDYHSPCKPHTKCEELGRALEKAGTSETDAVCGDVLTRCSWMLPAGLWSGLVLTALILFAVVICRRAKRRSYNAGRTSVPVTLTEVVPAPLPIALELPLPSTELNGHCQESCKLPLFTPDENLVNCSMDSSLPITPFKASVSFVESSHTNGSFLRTYSEPQEDEWCGT